MHRAPLRSSAITAAALLLAACGTETDPEAAASLPGADDASDGDVVEVSLVDFAFVGLPDAVPAGTRLTVRNDADAELHEVVAFRLDDADDRTVDELAELSPPELGAALGEPTTVLLATPGGPQIDAVGDGTLSEPGRYALMCFIPTGVEPQVYLDAAAATEEGPPQVEGAGPPHVVQGMRAELTVG